MYVGAYTTRVPVKVWLLLRDCIRDIDNRVYSDYNRSIDEQLVTIALHV